MDEAHARAVGVGHQQVGSDRPLDHVEQRLHLDVSNRCPERQRHILADDRCHGEQVARRLAQAPHPAFQDVPQQGRDARRAQVAQRPGAAVRRAQQVGLFERPQQLPGEEGVALRARLEIGHQPGFVRVGQPVTGAQQRADRVVAQHPQVEARRRRLAHQEREEREERVVPGQFLGAVDGDDQHRQRGEFAGQEAQQVEGGMVGPVQVVQQQHQGLPRGGGREDVPHPQEERRLAHGGAGPARVAAEGGWYREIGCEGHARQGLGPGAVGRRLAEVVAAPDQHPRALFLGLAAECLGQGGLTDARLAADEHQRPVASQGGIQGIAQRRLLALAADEGRCGREGSGVASLVGHRRPPGVVVRDRCRRV